MICTKYYMSTCKIREVISSKSTCKIAQIDDLILPNFAGLQLNYNRPGMQMYNFFGKIQSNDINRLEKVNY